MQITVTLAAQQHRRAVAERIEDHQQPDVNYIQVLEKVDFP